jgi:hypothetical protein
VKVSLHLGDCLDVLRRLPDCSVESLVTDPPAGISFMAKGWDSDRGGRDKWIAWLSEIMRECLRVLKPGGHALVWALPRTSHWTATAIEDAGFEIRDKVCHIFGSGFPKSLNVSKAIDAAAGAERKVVGSRKLGGNAAVSCKDKGGTYGVNVGTAPAIDVPITEAATEEAKQWEGWGTSLKPAAEDWILCRRPLVGTVSQNVLAHGTGGINVDACRIAGDMSELLSANGKPRSGVGTHYSDTGTFGGDAANPPSALGRWPANVVLSHDEQCDDYGCSNYCPIRIMDEQSGERPGMSGGGKHKADYAGGLFGGIDSEHTARNDSGGASRFFYVAKAPKRDKGADNKHPTVKNTKLMSYLCKLITPPGGTVLDPFMGSGSTGVAAVREGFGFLGIEREPEYFECAKKRIESEQPPLLAAS